MPHLCKFSSDSLKMLGMGIRYLLYMLRSLYFKISVENAASETDCYNKTIDSSSMQLWRISNLETHFNEIGLHPI